MTLELHTKSGVREMAPALMELIAARPFSLPYLVFTALAFDQLE